MSRRLLRVRRQAKRRKPAFHRQEYAKHRRLKPVWRRPKGGTSKLRRGEKARGRMPSTGYASPRAVRGLNPRGLTEVRIFNPENLSERLKGGAVVIASGVGRKKRLAILKKAEQLGIAVSNA